MLVASKQCFELEMAGIKLKPGEHTLTLNVSLKDQYILLSHFVWF